MSSFMEKKYRDHVKTFDRGNILDERILVLLPSFTPVSTKLILKKIFPLQASRKSSNIILKWACAQENQQSAYAKTKELRS